MDMENGDQVSKLGYLCPQDSRGDPQDSRGVAPRIREGGN